MIINVNLYVLPLKTPCYRYPRFEHLMNLLPLPRDLQVLPLRPRHLPPLFRISQRLPCSRWYRLFSSPNPPLDETPPEVDFFFDRVFSLRWEFHISLRCVAGGN